ncbi:hypothetical protein DMI70_07600 [Escherichia coli]|nr:hypothetical protein [Escherichia coli]
MHVKKTHNYFVDVSYLIH